MVTLVELNKRASARDAKIMVRRTYNFDEDVLKDLEVIKKYLRERYGLDADTAAVKSAIHYFARAIEEDRVYK